MQKTSESFLREFDNILSNPTNPFANAYKHLDKFARVLDESLEIGHNIRVDFTDEGDHYEAVMDIPGVSKSDIVIDAIEDEQNRLSIKATRVIDNNQKNKRFIRQERSIRSYERVLELPIDADTNKINAVYENGVLHLIIEKKNRKERVGRRVQVK